MLNLSGLCLPSGGKDAVELFLTDTVTASNVQVFTMHLQMTRELLQACQICFVVPLVLFFCIPHCTSEMSGWSCTFTVTRSPRSK